MAREKKYRKPPISWKYFIASIYFLNTLGNIKPLLPTSIIKRKFINVKNNN
jgi:hypothetical protein